jgi:hypothetical protein
LALGALLFAFLVVGAVLVFVLGSGGDSGEGAEAAASAKLMPQDTFMFASFNPHLDQAKNFEVIDRAWGDNPAIQKGLAEMLDSMKTEGIDYKADIEPWLGDEIAFSMGANFLTALDGAVEDTFEQIEKGLSGELVQPSTADAEVPQAVIAVATKDQAASDKFLDKLRAETEKGGSVEETEYKGIKIVYQESEMAYATVDGFVVLTAGGLEVMQAVIDAQEGANLAELQSYKDVLARLPADQIGYSYMDMGVYMDTVLKAAGPELAELPTEMFDPDQLKSIKGMGMSVGMESNGLRVEFVVTYDKDALPANLFGTNENPNKAAGHVPASALFYVSGTGLGDAIQMVLDMVKAMPDQPPDFDEQLNMLTAMLGVSVDELIEMLSGEFALTVTHDPAGIAGDPSVPVGASFLIEAKDQEKFEKLINSVSNLLAMGAEMELPQETINDVEVTTLTDPYSESMIAGWGVGKGFFALGTSRELLEAAFGGSGSKLADDATYKAAIAPLPDKKSGLFYINVEKLLQVVVDAMDPWDRESFEQEGRAILEPIKAISVGSEPYDKGKDYATGTFFILIESE